MCARTNSALVADLTVTSEDISFKDYDDSQRLPVFDHVEQSKLLTRSDPYLTIDTSWRRLRSC